MNTCTQFTQDETGLVPTRPTRWPFSTMQRFFKTARFTSVDLTDSIFATLPTKSEHSTESPVPPLPHPTRSERARLMPWRII